MYSYWEKNFWYDNFDVVIIGSGIVGLSAAYYMKTKAPGLKVAILERHSMPFGASTKNAGFACFGTVGEILADLETMHETEVKEIIRLRWKGLQRLREIHSDSDIHFRRSAGIEVFADRGSFDKCAHTMEKINDLVEEAIQLKNVFKIDKSYLENNLYSEAIYNSYEGRLNPVLLVRHLIDILRKHNTYIYNGVDVIKFSREEASISLQTNDGINIRTKKLVFCTNAFTARFFPELDLVPARNQVLVSEKINGFDMGGCYHFNKGYVYFREVDNRLLIGGARNIDLENESTAEFGDNEKIIDYLKDFAMKNILGKPFKTAYKWSGIIATGSNKQPIIQELENNVFAAVRLGGMGVAIGSELGYQVAELMEL